MSTKLLHLSFRLMTEKTFYRYMDESLLISDVKVLIETESEIAPENQRLIFKGQLLKDEYTLKSYGVKSGNTIHVVNRPGPVQGPEPDPNAPGAQTAGFGEGYGTQPGTSGAYHTTGQGPMPDADQTNYGYPMGIFMSPVYATISVSSGAAANTTENAMEQVASQFFSGVVNSLLTSFNGTPATPRLNNQPSEITDTTNSPEEELVSELELSTSILGRVTRTVKIINRTSRPRSGSMNSSNMSDSRPESLNSTGEFNNLVSTTGNVDPSNLRRSSATVNPNYLIVSQTSADGSVRSADSASKEDYDSRSGKVILIDPEAITSKLPWDSLKKLENIVFDPNETSTPTNSSSSSKGIPPKLKTKDVDMKSPSDKVKSKFFSKKKKSSSSGSTGGASIDFSDVLDDSEVLYQTNEEVPPSLDDFLNRFRLFEERMTKSMKDYNFGDRASQMERFRQLAYAMALKTRIDTALCSVFCWLQAKMVSPEKATAFSSYMGWPLPPNPNDLPPSTDGQSNYTHSESAGSDFTLYGTTAASVAGNASTQNGPVSEPVIGETNSFQAPTVIPSTFTPNNTMNSVPGGVPPTTTNTNTANATQARMDVNHTSPVAPNAPTNGTTTNQADLISRYRSSPEFSSRMARVRQTKLSDSYHKS